MPLIADKNYYADAGGSLVDEKSAKAAFLVARAGTVVDPKTAKQYGLELEEGEQEVRYRGRDVEGMRATESNEQLAARRIAEASRSAADSGTTDETAPAPARSSKKGAAKK